MKLQPLVLSLFLLSACKGGDKDTGDSAPAACEAELRGSFPEDGATDFYYLAPLEFSLSAEDPSASVSLQGSEGEVGGELSWDAERSVLLFQPAEPLQPSSAYQAELSGCWGSSSLSFQTSELGEARSESPLGRTYDVELASARFTHPPAIAGVVGGALRFHVLLGVQALEDGSSVDILAAIAEEGSDPPVQDFCSATVDFAGGDFSGDPTFHLGPVDATFSLPDHEAVLHSLEISGTFAPDASYLGGGALSATLDTRENVGMFQQMAPDVQSGDDICDMLGSFGVECTACEDGQPYCMELRADSIEAPEVEGLVLEEVAEAHSDPRCAED